MNYIEFKTCVKEQLAEYFPTEYYEIHIREVIKNNGLHMDGLCIFAKDHSLSPTIYLNRYYEYYKEGMLLADIIKDILKEYQMGLKNKPEFNCEQSYYEAVNDRVIMRLVNYEMNKEILEDCPYVLFHDLAVTFRWLAFVDEVGISSALISNKELMQWGIGKDRLYKDAIDNTKRLFPATITNLRKLMEDKGVPSEQGDFDLYVLTNTQGINGATCVLYNQVLKEFARRHKCGFYLLPSSIHEMMICMDEPCITEQMLLSLVKEANHMVVTMGEVLSDNIYYYDYESDIITMIKNC